MEREAQGGAPANPQPPPQEDYAGRRDLADLKQAYHASGQEAVRQRARAELLEQELQQYREQVAAANQRQQVPERGYGTPYTRLQELGVPAEDLRQAILGELQEALQPVVRQIEGSGRARQHMLSNYGQDYIKFEQDVAQYLQSDPQAQRTYNALFQADPAAAVEWGFLKFSESRRRTHGQEPQQVPGEGQGDARVPSAGGGGPARQRPDPRWDAAAQAWEAYQKDPNRFNAERYAKARIGMVLSDGFVNGEKAR